MEKNSRNTTGIPRVRRSVSPLVQRHVDLGAGLGGERAHQPVAAVLTAATACGPGPGGAAVRARPAAAGPVSSTAAAPTASK